MKIVDTIPSKYFDVLLYVLLKDSDENLLPEIYNVFGKEALIKFLDIFGGTRVEVPSRKLLEDAVMQVDIYITLSEKNDDDRITDLSIKHGISYNKVVKLFDGLSYNLSDIEALNK